MDNIVQLHSLNPEDLIVLIKRIIREELKQVSSLITSKSEDKYLTRQEAANFLRISETKLWNLDKTQKLPARRLDGKVLYLKSDLLNFSDRVS